MRGLNSPFPPPQDPCLSEDAMGSLGWTLRRGDVLGMSFSGDAPLKIEADSTVVQSVKRLLGMRFSLTSAFI